MVFPPIDPNAEFQTFHNVEGIQIIVINTDNAARYLEAVKKFFEENTPFIDPTGHTKVIQVYLKLPPLTTILSYMSMQIPEQFKWTAVAIVEPPMGLLNRFKPTIEMVVNALLRSNKGRYKLGFFPPETLQDPQPILEWLDKTIVEK